MVIASDVAQIGGPACPRSLAGASVLRGFDAALRLYHRCLG